MALEGAWQGWVLVVVAARWNESKEQRARKGLLQSAATAAGAVGVEAGRLGLLDTN